MQCNTGITSVVVAFQLDVPVSGSCYYAVGSQPSSNLSAAPVLFTLTRSINGIIHLI